MHDPMQLNAEQIRACGSHLRTLRSGASSREAVAADIVHYLYENFVASHTEDKQCALARVYKTHL